MFSPFHLLSAFVVPTAQGKGWSESPASRRGKSCLKDHGDFFPIRSKRRTTSKRFAFQKADIVDYAKGGEIVHWRDFLAAASLVRPGLGVSPSAWEAAQAVMGEKSAAIVIAAILQRGATITNAGGCLRELTRKAELNEFAVGPMLMALIGAKSRGKKRA